MLRGGAITESSVNSSVLLRRTPKIRSICKWLWDSYHCRRKAKHFTQHLQAFTDGQLPGTKFLLSSFNNTFFLYLSYCNIRFCMLLLLFFLKAATDCHSTPETIPPLLHQVLLSLHYWLCAKGHANRIQMFRLIQVQKGFVFLKWKLFFGKVWEIWSWWQRWQKQNRSAEPISVAVLPGAQYSWKQGLCWAFCCFFFPREKVMVYGKASSPDWTVPNLFLLACEDCLVQASSQSPGCDLS